MTKLQKLFELIDQENLDLSYGLTSGVILEWKIENLLRRVGFKDLTGELLEDNSFVSQPNGKYAAPDIVVMEGWNVVKIEIKSTSKSLTSKKPFWNRNTPQQNVIYIFGIKDIGVNYFLGQDILPTEFSKTLYAFFKDYLDVGELFSKYLKECGIDSKKNQLGFTPIIAPQFAERKLNATHWERGYFSEPYATQRKDNVKKWIKELNNE